MPSLSRRALFLLVLLFMAAYALRMVQLEGQSLWWDEGISLHLATSGLAEIARDRLDNIHPPLYFVALKGWLNLVGVSAFTGRYLSVLGALLQVPFVFAFSRAVMRGEPHRVVAVAPWLAAALAFISPLSVIYGQEIRVYAFLPLIFLGLLWLGERIITRGAVDIRHLVLLGGVAWLGLHLHYIAAFGIAYVALWGIIVFARRGRTDQVWRWLLMFGVVGLVSLPWFVAVLANWTAVQAEASAGTFATEPVPLPFLFAQVWAFQLTGLAGALGTPLVRVFAALAFGALVILIALRAARWDPPALSPLGLFGSDLWALRLRLLAHWAIPLVLALVVWSLRSFSHPRYVTMYTLAFLPPAAVLIWPARRWLTQTIAALFLALLVFLSLWGLGRYFFYTGAAKPDIRGVAQYLENVAGPGDVVLIPDTDWSLPFEYSGSAEVVMATLGQDPRRLPEPLEMALSCEPDGTEDGRCTMPRDVYMLDYVRGTRDWQYRVPFELERRGWLADTVVFDDLVLRHYVVDRPAQALPACPTPGSEPVTFGPVELGSSWVEAGADANTAVTVALCWQTLATADREYAAAVTLTDPLTGEQVGQATIPLRDAGGRPAMAWTAGTPVVTYHVIPLQPGTPPFDYAITTSLFYPTADGITPIDIVGPAGQTAGRSAALAEMALGPPVAGIDNPYQLDEPPRFPTPRPVSSGVSLAGVVVGGGQYRPGQTVRVSLLWQRDAGLLGDFHPEVRLMQDGRLLAANNDGPAGGRYLPNEWRSGELVREVRDLRLPADSEGSVDVVLHSGAARVSLGTIEVTGEGVLMTPPAVAQTAKVDFADVAQLIGFTVATTDSTTAETLPVELVWRSLTDGAATDYVVFVHVIDADGRLIGQHDGQPAGGTRPMSDWLAGEYIVDGHPVVFSDTAYTGPAQIRVGLYDPLSGTRLLTADGSDATTLPIILQIQPGP
jgi:hypothetical protein